MLVYKTTGFVTADIVVDVTGRPTRPRLVDCAHAEFEAATVEALLKWQFKPALKNGQPVEAICRVPVSFQFDRMDRQVPMGIQPAFKVPETSPAGYASEFQYDEPPLLQLHIKPVYPRSLLERKKKGAATIEFLIDPAGRARRIEIRDATDPDFGAATKAMVAGFRFSPAKLKGKETWTILARRQVFDPVNRDSPDVASAQRILRGLKSKSPEILSSIADLDEAVRPLYQPGVVVPAEIAKKLGQASAVVEFYVDRDGHVQLPRVVSASDEDFGWAAVTAVNRWIFSQPRRQGNPVDVLVQVPIEVSFNTDQGS